MSMTARIDLLPSPLDRLDPIAAAVRWWTSQMSDVFGRRVRKVIPLQDLDKKGRLAAGHVSIVLPETDAFVAKLTLPKGASAAHANAIGLRLGDLAPTDPARLQISAAALEHGADGAVTYAIAMARRDRLDGLEAQARSKGARTVRFHAIGRDEVELKSARTERRDRRSLILDGVLVALVLAGAVAAVALWTLRIEAGTQALTDQERNLRRAAVASEAARRDAALARDFLNRGVLDRRASAVLQALAELNKATPNGAWWTSVRWSPQEILISAQANDATATIEAISSTAKSWTVELSGPINAGAEGAPQAFELKLRPREVNNP
jgi:hypothetical protein